MIEISYNDQHGGNSAAVWIDDGGFIVYNNEDNGDDNFNYKTDENYKMVGYNLAFATLWENSDEAKDLIKEYFDEDIQNIEWIDGDDIVTINNQRYKINESQQLEKI